MKKVIINLLILSSICLLAQSSFAQTANVSSVVKIIAGSFDGERNFKRDLAGSGVIIDARGIIVTSRSVVYPKGSEKPFTEIWAGLLDSKRGSLRPNQAYRLTVMNSDIDKDIAILKIETRNVNQKFPAMQFGETGNLRYGQDLKVIGFMQANGTSVSTAEVSFLDFDDREDLLKVEGQFLKGIAGGAVVDRSGKLIGIPTRSAASQAVPFFNQDGEQIGQIAIEEVGLVVPIEAIQEFIRNVPNLFSFTIPSDIRKSITIEGAVTDKKSNNPISRATVGILVPNNDSRQYIESDEIIAYARTDERGAFKLNRKLKPGTYSVKVVHSDYKTEYKTIQIPTASGRLIFELTKESRIIIK
jgi:S1-C subfamily serine protease